MSSPRPQFDVIMRDPAEPDAEVTHRISLVWKDRLDGEREGASLALNQDGLDQHKATLSWHAAMVRLGHYKGGFWQFVEDLLDVQKAGEEPADPTQPAASTDSASPSPSATPEPPSPGS